MFIYTKFINLNLFFSTEGIDRASTCTAILALLFEEGIMNLSLNGCDILDPSTISTPNTIYARSSHHTNTISGQPPALIQ